MIRYLAASVTSLSDDAQLIVENFDNVPAVNEKMVSWLLFVVDQVHVFVSELYEMLLFVSEIPVL